MDHFEEPKSRRVSHLLEQNQLSEREKKRLQRESNNALARFRKK